MKEWRLMNLNIGQRQHGDCNIPVVPALRAPGSRAGERGRRKESLGARFLYPMFGNTRGGQAVAEFRLGLSVGECKHHAVRKCLS